MKRLLLVLAGALAAGAAQAEPALTARATELLSQAQSDAAVLASLPENTRVEVLGRKGAWSEVKAAGGQAGWVRMTSLKPEGAVQATPSSNPLSGLGSLLSAGRTSNTATVTTGVRGLDAEDLQNAQANPAEFDRMQKLGVDRNAAQAFAQRSKLTPAQVDYLQEQAPASGNNRNMEGS